MTDPQPIATAPRDGTEILAWSTDMGGWIVVAWDTGKGEFCETWDNVGGLGITVWVPLPPDRERD